MATDLETAERVTHILRRTENEVRKMQVIGMYRDVDIDPYKDESRIQETKDRIEGIEDDGYKNDNYTLLEIHCDLDLPGLKMKMELNYLIS